MYMMKSRGPTTEPWGTLHKLAYEEEKVVVKFDMEGAKVKH